MVERGTQQTEIREYIDIRYMTSIKPPECHFFKILNLHRLIYDALCLYLYPQ